MLEIRSKLAYWFCELCDCVIDEIVLAVNLVIKRLCLVVSIKGVDLLPSQLLQILLVGAEQFAMKVALEFL